MRENTGALGIDAVVFDLDGVIWHEFVPLDGAASTVAGLRDMGLKTAFLTNTSSRTPQFLAQKLGLAGIGTTPELVFTAGRITAEFIATHHGDEQVTVVVVGAHRVLLNQIRKVGLTAVALRDVHADISCVDPQAPLIVVLGYSRSFNHADVTTLLSLAPRVTTLYAPERDRWYGTADGPRPGGGWIVSVGEEILDMPATILGKPNPACLQTVARDIGVDVTRILMVGDSPASDIAAASTAGSISCLFEPQASLSPIGAGAEPDFVIAHLAELTSLVVGLERG